MNGSRRIAFTTAVLLCTALAGCSERRDGILGRWTDLDGHGFEFTSKSRPKDGISGGRVVGDFGNGIWRGTYKYYADRTPNVLVVNLYNETQRVVRYDLEFVGYDYISLETVSENGKPVESAIGDRLLLKYVDLEKKKQQKAEAARRAAVARTP